MVHTDKFIAALIRAFAGGRCLSESYASRLLTGNGDTIRRIDSGTSLTSRRAARIVQEASDHWPVEATWPAGIPRPTPAPPPGDPDEVVTELRTRRLDFSDPSKHNRSNWAAVENCTLLMMVAATQLNPDGEIASPNALCDALGVDRGVYYKAVAAAKRGEQPDEGSDRRQVFDALVDAGDVRFVNRRRRAAA